MPLARIPVRMRIRQFLTTLPFSIVILVVALVALIAHSVPIGITLLCGLTAPALITESGLGDWLQVLAGMLAAVLGISIPILLLLAESAANRAGIFVTPFLQRSGIVRVALLGIGVLFLLLTALFLWTLNPQFDQCARNVYGGVAFLVAVAPLYELARIVRQLPAQIAPASLEQFGFNYIHRELHDQLRAELDHKLAKRLLSDIYEAAQFRRHHFEKLPGYYSAIWDRRGWIVDVDVPRLEAALRGVQTVVNARTRGFYRNNPYDAVNVGEVAFSLPRGQRDGVDNASRLLRAFRVSPSWRGARKIRPLLAWLKSRAISAIRVEAEEEFENVINQYCLILNTTFQWPDLPDDRAYPGIGRWDHSFWAVSDLRDILAIASRSQNDSFVRWVVYSLAWSMDKGLRGPYHHSGDIPSMLGLFPTAFYNCIREKRDNAASAVYESLLRTFLDPDAFWAGISDTDTRGDFLRRTQVYFDALKNAALMLRQAVDEQSIVQVANIWRELQPEELGLDRFPVGAMHLEEIDGDVAGTAHLPSDNQQRLTLDDINAFCESAKLIIWQIGIAAVSYILEAVNDNLLDPSNAKSMIAPMWAEVPDVDRLVSVFVETRNERRPVAWGVFDRRPETRRAYAPNTTGKFILYFILKGLDLIRGSGISHPRTPANARDEQTAVEGAIDNVLVQWDTKWKHLVGVSTESAAGLSENLSRYLQASAGLWKSKQVEAVVRSPIDPGASEVFLQGVKEYENATPLLDWLVSSRLIVHQSHENEDMLQMEQVIENGKYSFTALAGGTSTASLTGKQMGHYWARKKSDRVAKGLLHRPKRARSKKSWQTLADYLEYARQILLANDSRLIAALIPDRIVFFHLRNVPGITHPGRTDTDKAPAAIWNGVPILNERCLVKQFVAVGSGAIENCREGELSCDIAPATEFSDSQVEVPITDTILRELLAIRVKLTKPIDVRIANKHHIILMQLKLDLGQQ